MPPKNIHGNAMARAGLLEARKTIIPDQPITRYRITERISFFPKFLIL